MDATVNEHLDRRGRVETIVQSSPPAGARADFVGSSLVTVVTEHVT
jgi:hypothetical protein